MSAKVSVKVSLWAYVPQVPRAKEATPLPFWFLANDHKTASIQLDAAATIADLKAEINNVIIKPELKSFVAVHVVRDTKQCTSPVRNDTDAVGKEHFVE